MKVFLVLTIFLSVISCKTSKNASSDIPTEEVKKSDEENVVLVQGKVRYFDGCGFVIEIVEDYQVIYLYAINLPEEFKQKNIKIEFSFRESRAMLPEGCKGEKVVSIENVKQLTQ
ncbi:MAG: hypothetical protein RI922_2513 [Bacteroidota bacterium]|jgi:hypothetical protein